MPPEMIAESQNSTSQSPSYLQTLPRPSKPSISIQSISNLFISFSCDQRLVSRPTRHIYNLWSKNGTITISLKSLPSIGHSMHQKNVTLSYALKKNQSANYISFVLWKENKGSKYIYPLFSLFFTLLFLVFSDSMGITFFSPFDIKVKCDVISLIRA